MKLAPNEYTLESLLIYLNENYKKNLGTPFAKNDINQYERKGILPYKYGGNSITKRKELGVVLYTLGEKTNTTKPTAIKNGSNKKGTKSKVK